MEQPSLGMHLLLVPDGESIHLPRIVRPEIISCINLTGSMCEVKVRERSVREDHIHVLVEIFNEEQAARFIAQLVERISETVEEYQPTFSISDQIHVTLLPSHHLEILTSYLLDQDRIHGVYSVQEEIELVFRTNKEVVDREVVN